MTSRISPFSSPPGRPLIVLETHDEKGALELFQRVARDQDKPLFRWTVTDGLQSARFGLQLEESARHEEPEAMLRHLKRPPRHLHTVRSPPLVAGQSPQRTVAERHRVAQ